MDNEDFIHRMQKRAVLSFGRELTPAEAAEQFALHPMATRIAHLESLRTPEAMSSVRETADRLAMERALKRTHETLRKVGR
jgi:hypothetical protein